MRNAECGMSNAESYAEVVRATTLVLTFRNPHSPFRILWVPEIAPRYLCFPHAPASCRASPARPAARAPLERGPRRVDGAGAPGNSPRDGLQRTGCARCCGDVRSAGHTSEL